jgi:hypothetical protein
MPFIMRYHFSQYRERQRARYINLLPLSVEHTRGRFSCAAGAKVGLHLSATAVTTVSDMKAEGVYEKG